MDPIAESDSDGAPDPVAAAARARRRARAETDAAHAEATITSVVAGLAATGARVVVETLGGTSCAGILSGLGSDHVVVSLDERRRTAVRLDVIARVDVVADGDTDIAPIDPTARRGTATLTDLIAELADADAPVTLRCGRADVTGRIRWCGDDVAAVDRGEAGRTYVWLGSVSELSFSSSLL